MRFLTDEECGHYEDIFDPGRLKFDPTTRYAARLAAATSDQLMREKIAAVLSGKSVRH